jgi:hypothetical protein
MDIKLGDAEDRPCTDAALTVSTVNAEIVPHIDHAHALSHIPQSIIHCNTTEHSIRDTTTFSASQEIPRILCNPMIRYRHHSSPPFTIRSQMNSYSVSQANWASGHTTEKSEFTSLHGNIFFLYSKASRRTRAPTRFKA